MRAALLLFCAVAAADEAQVAKAREIANAGPAAAREAIPELIAIGKGSAWERFAARDALVVAGPPAVARLIEGASGDGSLRLLLEGVSFDLGAGVVAPALPLLSAESPKVRAMAAASLGAAGRGGEAAVKQLVTALHDKDADVRREAATALGSIGRGAHDAIPGLLHLANDPSRGCQREALLAMGAILRDAAERERPAPKVAPEVAKAIERGVTWLLARQDPGGSWDVPAAPGAEGGQLTEARACTTAIVALALLESGDRERCAQPLRTALRYVVEVDESMARCDVPHRFGPPWWATWDSVIATLCAATRVVGEPEYRSAAARAFRETEGTGPAHVFAMAVIEAGNAGLLFDPSLREMNVADAGAEVAAMVRLAAGRDPRSDEMQRLIERCGARDLGEPKWWAFAARARWYGGVKSDALVESVLKQQREDGSFEHPEDEMGPAHATACMLLALEAASGLARPLTMPLPDATQLKAAVATLRIAAQSKDAAIKAAAEQALAGFAVR